MMTHDDLEQLFTYHPPVGDQADRYESLRRGGRALAELILLTTPASADQSAAVRKVREAIMTANAAIACGESLEEPAPHSARCICEECESARLTVGAGALEPARGIHQDPASPPG